MKGEGAGITTCTYFVICGRAMVTVPVARLVEGDLQWLQFEEDFAIIFELKD